MKVGTVILKTLFYILEQYDVISGWMCVSRDIYCKVASGCVSMSKIEVAQLVMAYQMCNI